MTRRRLLLLGLLPLLAALAFAGKVTLMVVADRDGRAAYSDGEFGDARDRFLGNRSLNVLEPWLAPYDEGTARYRLADFPGARTALERALVDVPSAQECTVRTNLALTHEALGDAALADGRPDAAARAWQAGVAVLTAGACVSTPAASVEARLRNKLAGRTAQDDVATDPGSPDAAELLTRLNERGEKIRQRAEQRQRDREDEPRPADPQETPPPSYAW